jgi:hypothetical protein
MDNRVRGLAFSRRTHGIAFTASSALLGAAAAILPCVGVLFFFPAATAEASPSVICTPVGHVLDLAVSGSPEDTFTVTTDAGDYEIELDGVSACGQTYTDTPSTYPTVQVTEESSYVPVIFEPGTDTGVAFFGPGGATTSLDLSLTNAGTTATLNGNSISSPGLVQFSQGSDAFSGVSRFVGSSAGDTSFVSEGIGGNAFEGLGSGNSANFSADPDSVSANLYTGTVGLGPGAMDTVSDVATVVGSSSGGNDFVVGTSGESFADPGTAGGDTVDFSNVSTSAASGLVVNVSGAPSGSTSNDTATVGPLTYSFISGGANFTSFVGAAAGHTTFLAGTRSETFAETGTAGGDTIDFSAVPTSANSRLTVNDSGGPSGGVPGDTATVGSTTFSFASGGANFTGFVGAASGNTTFFDGAPGSFTFNGIGSNNELDSSALGSALTLNESGRPVGSTPNGTATTSGATYEFNDISTFAGSSAGSTFYAGSTPSTFEGVGTSSLNSLSFAAAPNNPLTFCIVASSSCPTPDTALFGSTDDTFSGIGTYVGDPAGDSTFVAGGSAGLALEGLSGENTADFSADPYPVSANLDTGAVSVTPGATDTVSGISSVVGSSTGSNTFVAGPTSESFADSGTAGGDTIDFSNVQTSTASGLLVNVSGTPSGSTSNDTATAGPLTYSFISGGARFTSFVGAASGNTAFIANPKGGYDFAGAGTRNDLVLNNVPSSSTLTTNDDSDSSPGRIRRLDAGFDGSTVDTFAGIQSFVGFPGDAITSVNNASDSRGTQFSFAVTTTGNPTPKLSENGTLPNGVSFVDNHNGTASLSGTPTNQNARTYRFTIDAQFGKGASKKLVTQAFTLTVT